MITISLCMIVKNEEEVLARCLESVKDAVEEMIIVDTGSSDRTKEIAAGFTDKVFDYTWIDDFASARNFSFSKAAMEYCMWLDADDVLTAEDRQKLLELKRELQPDTDVIMARYHTAFDDKGNPTFSYYRERILRRCPRALWKGKVHEAISPWGKIYYADFAISHKKLKPSDADRNLRIYERQIAQGEELSPRDLFYYGRELYYHRRWPEAAAVLERFLKEGQGWLENDIEACRFLAYSRYGMKQGEKALEAFLLSLKYDEPRAEICCDIGKHFLDLGQYRLAVFWYELALTRKRNDTSGAFVSDECYGYLPCIQLCVCYDRLGHYLKAAEYNERAGRYKPDSAAVQTNRRYFGQKGVKSGCL